MDDHADFDEWYRATHPRLVSAMTFITADVSVATEVVDEAFVRAYERWSRVGAMDAPAGWTYRTALNAFRRRQRRASLEERLLRRHAGSTRTDVGPPPDWSPETWDAVGRLPERQRIAVALRYVADLTTVEMAEAMGTAEGTVGSTLHAARRTLTDLLGDEGRELDPPTPGGQPEKHQHEEEERTDA
jgi:RNA polymerase sigma-70 factor (ECF subfamily)